MDFADVVDENTEDEFDNEIGPGTTIALILGLMIFYGLFIAIALARA
jgi:hypothetical protein